MLGLQIYYFGSDITRDIMPAVAGITITDVLEGESDTLEISLFNENNRWMDSWLPGDGDEISLRFGYENSTAIGPLNFEIDKLRFTSPPSLVKIGALGTPIKKSLREKRSQTYENVALLDIANTIANRQSLKLIGAETIPAVRFKAETQKFESDLHFLRRISANFGIMFKVDGLDKLVFFKESALESAQPVITIARGDMSQYEINRKNAGTYRQAKISHFDADTGDFISVTVGIDGEVVPTEGAIASGDLLNISKRVESLAIARTEAQEALTRANRSRVELRVKLSGETLISAGVTVQITGMAVFDGKYLVERARHTIGKTFETSFNAHKIQ